MNTDFLAAPFKERPVINSSNTEPHEYDIACLNATETYIEQYCTFLLNKLLSLTKSKIKPFIQYQCEQLEDPFVWLNKFEKLIDLNRNHPVIKEQNIKVEKALVVIELLRQEIEAKKFSSSKFNFKKVKQKIQRYQTPEEKMSYLLEAKTEYLQYKPAVTDPGAVPFDIQCELEMNLIKTQRKLTKKKVGRVIASPLGPLKKSPESPQKFQINTNLNQFVDIFYQLMYEKQVNGKPGLEASPNDLAELIAAVFKDKEGKEISVETVKTILKPSRFEKRPKGGSRILI